MPSALNPNAGMSEQEQQMVKAVRVIRLSLLPYIRSSLWRRPYAQC